MTGTVLELFLDLAKHFNNLPTGIQLLRHLVDHILFNPSLWIHTPIKVWSHLIVQCCDDLTPVRVSHRCSERFLDNNLLNISPQPYVPGKLPLWTTTHKDNHPRWISPGQLPLDNCPKQLLRTTTPDKYYRQLHQTTTHMDTPFHFWMSLIGIIVI